MLELYTLINSKTEGIVDTYVGHYPTDQLDDNGKPVPKIYPYAEINFPDILPNNTFSDNNLLEIDIWDNKDTDITEIEALADAIHKVLNRFQYNDSVMNVSINRATPYRVKLPDPIPYIQRRKLRYNVKVYYK